LFIDLPSTTIAGAATGQRWRIGGVFYQN